MPADQPIYGIKSRGQAGLDELTNLEEMAAYYLREVRAFRPQGPYCLGGYCFGGNVAYEMARQLRAQGEQAVLVALLDTAPANAGYERAQWWHPSFGYRFGRNLYYWLDDFAKIKPEERRRFVARKTRAFGRRLKRRLKLQEANGSVDLEDVIDLEQFPENELKLWEVHLHALAQHQDKSYPGPVTLFRTRGQPLVCSFEEDFCWNKLAPGGLTVRRIRGSHENIFMEPNVQFLARELERCLAEATKATGGS
jgi:thioesterase domain-containing protein